MQTILAALLGSSTLALAALQVTVSPNGSVAAARDAIRAKRQAGEQGPAVITLDGGVYNWAEALVLDARDSDLTLRAAKGAKPLLLGGSVVKAWSPYHGKILKADVSKLVLEGAKYRQLLCGGQRMNLARYPNFTPDDPLYGGWAFAEAPPAGGKPAKESFLIKPQDLRQWAHPADVEVDIVTGEAWGSSILALDTLDPATRTVTLVPPGAYEILANNRFHFQNALEELDAPGEWFLDPRTKILYFWPPAGLGQAEVRLVTLASFIEVKAGTKNLSIERLAFTGCIGTAITLSGAEDCRIAGCTLSTVGGYRGSHSGFGAGLSVTGGKHNIVTGNDISYTGGSGINVSGGDRITLTPAGHEVTNNDIHHVGVFSRGSSGVEANGCGILIAHNQIHDCPRMAMVTGGNQHVVEYNHLYQLCLETNDGGAIYTGGRDWIGGRGTVWRYNRVHDVVGCGQTATGLKHPAYVFGLYPDDNSGGVDIIGNLVYRIGHTAIHMHNSRDCLLENNVFAFCGKYQFDLHGWTKDHFMFTTHLPTMIQGYESVAGQPAWQGMRGMELHPKDAVRADGTIMSGNVLRRNIMISNSPGVKHGDMRNCSSQWNTLEMNLVWNGEFPVNTGLHKTGPDKDPPLLVANFDGLEPGLTPAGWSFTGKAEATAKLIVADNALRADCSSGATPATSAGIHSKDIPVTPGASYRVRLRVRSTEPHSRVVVSIATYQGKAGPWHGQPAEITATPKWQDLEAVASFPALGDPAWKPWMATCCVNVQSKETKGRIFIDDVRLCEAEPLSEWAAWQAAGWDKNSLVADPLFEDLSKDDYRLKPESPAIRQLGFKPLPIEKMGLIQDPWRTF